MIMLLNQDFKRRKHLKLYSLSFPIVQDTCKNIKANYFFSIHTSNVSNRNKYPHSKNANVFVNQVHQITFSRFSQT